MTLEPLAAHPEKIKLAETKKALKEGNVEVIGHTAYYLPFASPLEKVRKAAVEEMRSALIAFVELGVSKVTVHPDKSIPFALGLKGILQRNLLSFAEVDALAKPMGIQILIENMDRTFNTKEQLQETFSQLPQLGFHLDVGHANLNSEKNRTEEFLQAFHNRLMHVHLSDNFGRAEDLHLPLGVGNIDWKKMVSLIKGFGYDGTITLEVFSPDRRYLLASRDKLRELWLT